MNDKNGRLYDLGSRLFRGNSRSAKRAGNIMGLVNTVEGRKNQKYRKQSLNLVEQYVNGTQYNGLVDWDAAQASEDHVSIYSRKPRIIYPFAKVFADRISGKLVGQSTFPKLKIEDDPEAEYFANMVVNGSFLKPNMLEAAKSLALYNSVFLRFKFVNGTLRIQTYEPNYCYPEFNEDGTLLSVRIQYVYKDESEMDATGAFKQKWFKMELTENADILFDNPDFSETSSEEPLFTEVSRAEHNMGFVQGEWICIGDTEHSVDGSSEPFLLQIKDFIDALNYNLSQTQSSTAYGLDPQLAVSGMDQDEVEDLIKSSSKAWLLGREGKADFLEVAGSGLDKAKDTREDFFKRIQDIARIVMLDPEKMVGSAQSGKAMEILHAPMVELINEMRPWVEKGIISFVQKLISSIVLLDQMGFETQYTIPDGWIPQSMDIKALWPPIFEPTTQDKQQIVSLALQITNGNLISRATMAKWLQSQGLDFGVEDWDLETQKVDAQKTFGGFF